MGPFLDWAVPFGAASFGILCAVVVAGSFAARYWRRRGLMFVFLSAWVVVLVAIPALSELGPPLTWRNVTGLGLFIGLMLTVVAIPTRLTQPGVTTGRLVANGLVAAAISAVLSPYSFLWIGTILGDG